MPGSSESGSLHTSGVVNDYFKIESHLLSTKSADLYRAVDKTRGPVCLWIMRHPLAIGSEGVRRFLARMHSIAHCSPPVCEMSAYGVDAQGTAFVVFPNLDGFPVVSGNLEASEAERRFMSCLNYVQALHDNAIVCGDICGSSFWVNRGGDVRFIGVMGTFDAEAVATALMPPIDTLPYLAPEQLGGGGAEQTSDVFALGVLGYYLLSRRYPYGEGQSLLLGDFDIAKVEHIGAYISPPLWAEEVLTVALNPVSGRRYRSAGEMLTALVGLKSRAFARESIPVPTKARPRVDRPGPGGPVHASLQQPLPPRSIEGPAIPAEEPTIVKPKILALGLALGLGVLLLVVFLSPQLFRRSHPVDGVENPNGEQQYSAAGNKELKEAIDVISESEGSIEAFSAHLEKVASSDDPLAHDVLVKSARDAKTRQMRELSEKAIIDRANRLGLMRSSEQVKQWLRTVRDQTVPPGYEAVLQSLDTTLPIEARSSLLRQAYAHNPNMVLRLAVGLAIDSNKIDVYQTVLSQLIGDALKLDGASQYSGLALILAHPDLSLLFGDDLIKNLNQLKDTDLTWLLNVLSDRNDINIRPIASLALERNVVPPVRATFLKVLRDRGDLSPEVINALVRAATASLRVEDVASFGRWYDLDAERILLAILADNQDKAILEEAFDTVAGKSLTVEPSASLVEWIRKNYWDKRLDFARAVGILGNLDKVNDTELQVAFAGFDQYVRDSELIDILIRSGQASIIRTIIAKYPDMIGPGSLLNLLDNDSKDVRIAAISALKSSNDIGVLKMVIDHYEKEKDSSVREVYKDSFWMIKQRQP